MCSGSEMSSYLRFINSCITQLKVKDLLGSVTRVNKKKIRSGSCLHRETDERQEDQEEEQNHRRDIPLRSV